MRFSMVVDKRVGLSIFATVLSSIVSGGAKSASRPRVGHTDRQFCARAAPAVRRRRCNVQELIQHARVMTSFYF